MYNIKIYVLFAISFLWGIGLNAQNMEDKIKHKIFLKTNPFSLFEPDAGLTFGVDVLGKGRWNFSGDIVFVFFNPFRNSNKDNFSTDGVSSPLGLKFKPELRYYFLRNGKDTRQGFLSFEGLFTMLDNKIFRGVTVFDNNGNLAYLKRTSYNEIKKVIGLSLKTGYRLHLVKNSDKHIIEMHVGFGLRQKFFTNKNVEFGTTVNSNDGRGFLDLNIHRGIFPSLPLGVKYVIGIK